MMKRRTTRVIEVGAVKIGGGNPIVVQSMTNTLTKDVDATVAQVSRLMDAGAGVVRLAVPDRESALALRAIKRAVRVPLIADIHFDYRLAVESVRSGIDGLRINPGNIGSRERIREVVGAAKDAGIPIRVGVNAGSLPQDILEKHKFRPTAGALVDAAVRNIRELEDLGFHSIKVSVKSSSVPVMIDAYRRLSRIVDYPLHLGVTEAGTVLSGSIKSAIGMGALLSEGIGDTIRVSLTDDPVIEVKAGYEILRALGIARYGVEIISCPTCARAEFDVIGLVNSLERKLINVQEPLTVAVMGCVVNGPGEAKEADIGIACGKGSGMLFKHGKIVGKIQEADYEKVMLAEIDGLLKEKK
ncbi:MAG: flavodoxin-dependent (E)-4-hydroxy-3-methylbut-2-enyl-diphosphate synthase [Deltaproteobacteria bacterium]|nr:flavodoxin-dependent (E)-4-hydroxy-3-methylbut-2-enyl-diphosphate synthase [Deltaproteobacteria bacterium]